MVISGATYPLIQRRFQCQPLGAHALRKAFSADRAVPGARREGRPFGLTPLVGRGAGNGAAAGALGAGQGRPRAGGAAQRRGGHRQIAPGAGAEATGGRRAPGLADAVPMFALLPEQRLVSADRAAGAGAALRAGGVPPAEAAQTGGVLVQYGLPWRRPCPSLPPSSRCRSPELCPTDLSLAPAAEAEDPPDSPDDPAAHRRPAARALRHGRPALGRSVHAGAAQPPGRSRPHRPHPGAVHLSAGLSPALDGAARTSPS